MSLDPMLLMLALLVLLPLMLVICLAAPVSGGIYLALLRIHTAQHPHGRSIELAPEDVQNVLRIFHQKLQALSAQPFAFDDYAQLLLLPAAGLLIGCYLLYRGCCYICSIFTIDDLK